MSFYSSSVKTNVIDPVYFNSKNRVEFRLEPDMLYLSNMRITNLGIKASGDDLGLKYNELVGAYGVVKRIALLDGNTTLDEIRSSRQWMTFLNYLNSNDKQKSTEKWKSQSNFGFQLTTFNPDKESKEYQTYYPSQGSLENKDEPQYAGYLMLRDVLGFLEKTEYLHGSLFKNLRIVIDFNLDYLSNIGVATTSGTEILEPVLIVDSVNNMELANQVLREYKGTNWQAIEVDTIFVDNLNPASAADNNTKTQKSFRVNGFNNKRLNRLLIAKEGLNYVEDEGVKYSSPLQIGEEIQVKVNGANKLPRNGLTRPNQRLAMLNDIWSEANTIQGFSNYNTGSNIEIYNSGDVNLKNYCQILDYSTLRVDENIEDLQIDYTRKPLFDGGKTSTLYNQKLNLNLFGEVDKSVVVQGDKYSVVYNQ